MKIAIVDDERPSRSELRYLIEKYLPYAEIEEANSGQGLMKKVLEIPFDVIFLDINLGDVQGIELAALVKGVLPEVSIVFATAYDEFAVKAFEMEAMDYIMKPFDEKRIELTMKKIMRQHKRRQVLRNQPIEALQAKEQAREIGKLAIGTDKKLNLVDIKEIAFIEVDERACKIHTFKGTLQSGQSLKYFEEKLGKEHFLRIHKSYMINLKYVTEIEPSFNNMYVVKLRGFEREALPVSRNHIKKLKEYFLN